MQKRRKRQIALTTTQTTKNGGLRQKYGRPKENKAQQTIKRKKMQNGKEKSKKQKRE